MTSYKLKTPKGVEKTVVNRYKKIEEGVIDTYKKIEDDVVSCYKKIENKFVDTFLEEVDHPENPVQPTNLDEH